MAFSGTVSCADWRVLANTREVAHGFECSIRVELMGPDGSRFEHGFVHGAVFDRERDAILAGLQEGMVWVDLKRSRTIGLHP